MTRWRRVAHALRGTMMRTVPLMATCAELEWFIDDWLEGNLPWRQRVVFDLHLRMCTECRCYVEAYRATIAAGRRSLACEDAEPLAEVPEDLVRAVLAAREADE